MNSLPASSPTDEKTATARLRMFDPWFKFAFRVLLLILLALGVAVLGRYLLNSLPTQASSSDSPSSGPPTVRGLFPPVLAPSQPAVSYRQRELEVARLAKSAGSKLVKEHFDGGQAIETYIDSWWYQPEEKQYTADVTVKWSGSVFSSNKYWVKGSLRLPEAGSSYRFNQTDCSETLNDYQSLKFGLELADALLSDSKSKSPQTDTFKGIGAQFKAKEIGDMLTMDALVPGTPAARSILRAGDRIASINGKDTKPLTSAECVNLIRGSSEDNVTFVVSRFLEPDQTITLTKEVITVTK